MCQTLWAVTAEQAGILNLGIVISLGFEKAYKFGTGHGSRLILNLPYSVVYCELKKYDCHVENWFIWLLHASG